MSTIKLRLALDWTPNTNHTGFYVAIDKKFYSDVGIELEIVPPSKDYTEEETPARSVVNGRVDLCIAPSESAVSCWTSDKDIIPIAIAAVLQTETSAIAVKESSTIKSLADLAEKKYASYGGRFEIAIINQIVKNDGGTGEVIEVVPPKLDCFDSLLRDEVESTWIFSAWEGINAELKGIKLRQFPITLSNSTTGSYGYSPLLLAHPDLVQNGGDILNRFLAATEKGYQFATSHPQDAADSLVRISAHPSLAGAGDQELVKRSQDYLSQNNKYLDVNNKWGRMEKSRWTYFLDWLFVNNLVQNRKGENLQRSVIEEDKIFTNKFFN